MYLLLSGFTLIRIIILLLIRFSYFTITKSQFPSSGIVLGLKPKKIKIRAPTILAKGVNLGCTPIIHIF
jgi:hypothetical protein